MAQKHVIVEQLVKTYPGSGAPSVDHVDFDLEKGEMLALLGPSGCGKTTILRMVAGLITPTSGRIQLNGQDIAQTPVHRRNMGMVFQSYALFPHMSVAENVAFGLQMRGVPKQDRAAQVERALDLVKLKGFGDRRITQLSGGQQQRCAIARSLVIEPDLLLLDEPLSNLDARLRLEMRTELQRVQKETGVTMVFVTHDQVEALALADRIVVMLNGGIEQIGTPEEIYNRPVSAFVADFVGFENVFAIDGGRLKAASGGVALSQPVPSDAAGLAWRPRAVLLGGGPFQGRVRGTSFAGNSREYLLDTSLGPIKAEVDAALAPHPIDSVLAFDLPVAAAAVLKRLG